MNAISSRNLLAAGLFLINAAFASASPFDGSSVPHHACQDAAYSQHASALQKASDDFEADAAACYELLNAGEYIAVSLCLKASEASRKESVTEAELALSLALGTCQEVSGL